MSTTAFETSALETRPTHSPSGAGDELVALGWEINANQYRLVHLAAQVDEELDWFRLGYPSASAWIASHLQIQTSTAREWVRVGHALRYLSRVDVAFAEQEISYAKVRVLTRWADEDNEAQLLELARERAAGRLTVAISKFLADDGESDAERDVRLHEERSFTTWTDGDGMTIVRIVLPPSVAKPVVAAVDELVRRIAAEPLDEAADPNEGDADSGVEGADPNEGDADSGVEGADPGEVDAGPSADGDDVETDGADVSTGDDDADADKARADRAESGASADAFGQPSEIGSSLSVVSTPRCAPEGLGATLRELRRRWQPDASDAWVFPSLAQQRADAFVALFLGCDVDLTTEIVVHVRGDGVTFDDGTPTTGHAVVRQLDDSFVRLLIHDADRRPINASRRQRHPTTRQKRVVLEAHGHECVDCQSTELLELDHVPAFQESRRTVVEELEPRCAPCHRARHRDEQHRAAEFQLPSGEASPTAGRSGCSPFALANC